MPKQLTKEITDNLQTIQKLCSKTSKQIFLSFISAQELIYNNYMHASQSLRIL